VLRGAAGDDDAVTRASTESGSGVDPTRLDTGPAWITGCYDEARILVRVIREVHLRLRTVASLVVLALLIGSCGNETPNPAAPSSLVVPSEATLGLGEHQRFEAAMGTVWSLPAGAQAGYVSQSGMYYAPLRAPAVTTVKIVATFGVVGPVGSTTAEATVHLTTDAPDSLDCLAEGQSADGYPLGTYVYAEELPEAIVKVSPTYPDLARERGVEGTVMVMAHVCACGEVSETRIVKSIPMLDEAASAAVQQWLFQPARSSGEPVAVWVGIPVKFSLH
jgi:TonB family protein